MPGLRGFDLMVFRDQTSKFKYVYMIWAVGTSIYKIGISKDVEQRMKQLQYTSSHKLQLVHKFLSDDPYQIERAIHQNLRIDEKETPGEWFELTPGQVWLFKTIRNFPTIESAKPKDKPDSPQPSLFGNTQ